MGNDIQFSRLLQSERTTYLMFKGFHEIILSIIARLRLKGEYVTLELIFFI